MVNKLAIGWIFLCLIACNAPPSSATLLDAEVMRVHDEAMAKSALVLQLKKAINLQIDSTSDSIKKNKLQNISAQLYKADRLMLDWMHQYQAPNLESDTAMLYLKIQLDKINEVHSITFESIKRATDFIQQQK
jgi:hypothetical protein